MTRCPRCQRRLPSRGECPVHGRPSVVHSAVDDPTPAVVAPAGFTLGRQIAVGGSAYVYSVTGSSGAPAILKWGRWRERDVHERFAREAQVLRTLGPPATPAYLAHGSINDTPYLLMEEVPGETLAAWMARSGERGAVGEIVAILLRLAKVLKSIHAAGYIHRDLKPENVVIGTNDTRILDFGLAAVEGEGISQIGSIVGTVHYLAPEQIRTGSTIDRRADIYSFGVMAFEMIAGQPPFIGERRSIEYQHQVVRPPALREIRQIPNELEDLVLACLAKQPEARPQTAAQLHEALTHATAYIQTLKGVGTSAKKVLGARDRVVLAWIEGGDPITIARALNDVHGIIVRSRPGGILAAFASLYHDAPLGVAIATCRELVRERCRIVIHLAGALVRRSAQGKPSFYGPDIEQTTRWTPPTPFTGLVLTEAAAELASDTAAPASDVPGFWRELQRTRTDATEPHREPPLIGRERLIQELAAVAGPGGMLINISGPEGAGKTRVLAALAERLRATKHDVISVRGKRRFVGERQDDEQLIEALGAQRVIVLVDDARWLSPKARRALLAGHLSISRVVATREPLFEVTAGVKRHLAIELPPLPYADADRLLRDQLVPARLIPDVLLQRLAIRAAGNPGVLVALARDIKRRGGIRRNPGGDEWYVAADEIDTLLASPSPAWFAVRALEDLPVELAPVVRMSSALGPRFSSEEVASVTGLGDVASRLALLVRDGMLVEQAGWYEFSDASLQDAIYDHALDERSLVHHRALQYWLGHRGGDVVGWLARVAHHATGAGDAATAGTCFGSLALEARRRGDDEQAADLGSRQFASQVGIGSSSLLDTLLDDD